jgi:hypothetical protein
MTWNNLGGGSSFQKCEELGYHRLGAHVKFINENKHIFIRACRRCPYTYVGQVQLKEDHMAIKAKVVQLTDDQLFKTELMEKEKEEELHGSPD